ncbi:MAG TPA: DUF5069 domain-containing protein [Verrucomicrobiae bacterium]|jgi:hypothetical protein|nr:DUF5069 domain-containing protein [Verrucomicrobiae bacterium]
MNAPDLRRVPPRRWTIEIDGIRWLPRLIDKTRAALAGTLGAYLYGQSPADRALLGSLGIRYRDFTAIVRQADSDDAVFAALRTRDPQSIERARAWSADLPSKQWAFLLLIDIDDGYLPGMRWVKTPLNLATAAFCGVVKAVWPSRAAEPRE